VGGDQNVAAHAATHIGGNWNYFGVVPMYPAFWWFVGPKVVDRGGLLEMDNIKQKSATNKVLKVLKQLPFKAKQWINT